MLAVEHQYPIVVGDIREPAYRGSVEKKGIEPLTSSLQDWRSTI